MTPKINKILYATDLSENAKYAFGYAADLSQKYDAHITILYVMEYMAHTIEVQVSEMVGPEKWQKLKLEKQEYLTKKIQTRVEDFCKEMSDTYDSCLLMKDDILIGKGSPQEIILSTSRQIGADMIVMGTHGYNALKDALIGGTARRVVKKSKVPVLVVQLPEE